MKHAPGPWTVSFRPEAENEYLLWDADYNYLEDTSLPCKSANARLIAAAPELLEALQAIQARINGNFDNPKLFAFGPLSTSAADDCLEIAHAAIAKATGENK